MGCSEIKRDGSLWNDSQRIDHFMARLESPTVMATEYSTLTMASLSSGMGWTGAGGSNNRIDLKCNTSMGKTDMLARKDGHVSPNPVESMRIWALVIEQPASPTTDFDWASMYEAGVAFPREITIKPAQ
jgi:hypothetical protein